MNSVTVATFHELEPAELLKKRLEESGISARVHDERKLQRLWFMSEPLAGIKLKVAESREEKANALLKNWNKKDRALKDAIFCPECGSPDIEYPQMPRKFLATSLMEILFALRFLDREFYCYHCHYSWPRYEHLDVQRDALGWPIKARPEENPPGKTPPSKQPAAH